MHHRLILRFCNPQPLQIIVCRGFSPLSVSQGSEKKSKSNFNNQDNDDEVELVTSFNEPIPTRDYP